MRGNPCCFGLLHLGPNELQDSSVRFSTAPQGIVYSSTGIVHFILTNVGKTLGLILHVENPAQRKNWAGGVAVTRRHVLRLSPIGGSPLSSTPNPTAVIELARRLVSQS